MESTAVLALPFFGTSGSRTAYRRLAKDKHEVEARLTSWGKWTRAKEQGGYPSRSVTERAREGGVMAGSPRPPTTLPEEVAQVDRIVAKLPLDWQRAARSNWQYGELPREQRAARIGMSEGTFKLRVESVRREVSRELKL